MRWIYLTPVLAAVALVAAFAFSAIALAEHFDPDFRAHLTGGQVAGREGDVRTRAQGDFDARVLGRGNRLQFELTASRIDDVTAIHLHRGARGENGPVVARLGVDRQTRDGRVVATGVLTRDDLRGPFEGRQMRALIRAMRNGDIYVDVHTMDHPRGEIRGQVREVPNRARDLEDERDDDEEDDD